MKIEVNNNNSYLGKDIRAWAEQGEDWYARDVHEKYYSDASKFTPNDKVFYYIDYVNWAEAKMIFGSSIKSGCTLRRDLNKSPRIYKKERK